jgi:hypothetical protein
LGKYDISVGEALKHGWKYSRSKDQLLFLFYTEGVLTCYQARNFNPRSRTKYYTQGEVGGTLPIFKTSFPDWKPYASRTLVVVEDSVSAAKISRQCDAMPCLGSHLPVKKIIALKPFYERLTVWLDSNKLKEAMEIADKAKWVGMGASVIHTDLDPKEYDDKEVGRCIDGRI